MTIKLLEMCTHRIFNNLIKQNQKLGSDSVLKQSTIVSSAQRPASRVQRPTLASRVQEFRYALFCVWLWPKKLCNCHSFLFFLTSFLALFLEVLPKVISKFFFCCCFNRMWQVGAYEYDISCLFQPCPLEKNSNGILKEEYVESCF